MGTRSLLLLLVAIGFAVLFVHPGSVALGEDAEKASGVWVYDLRVVRVDTAALETPEAAGTWEPGGDGTTTKPWPEVLKALKERGQTLLLMDQRVTTLPGKDVQATQQKDMQIKSYQNSDFNNERHQAAPLQSGCTMKLKPEGTATQPVRYDVTVRWVLPKRLGALRALLGTTSWGGHHGSLDGKTLVLTYREQIEHEDGERQGLEIYAFLTGRYVP